MRSAWFAVIMTFVVWAIIYGVNLGVGGLANTEGHRVAPALAMMEGEGLIVPRLFGHDYLRKPPGMPWAIAASMTVFGKSVLAARLVSAISIVIAALASLAFAVRWFGRAAALPTGLAATLMPWMWAFGRAAEIEAINNLGVTVASLAAFDIAWSMRRKGAFSRVAASGAVLLAGVTVMLFAKGPAGAPVVGGAFVASLVFARGARLKSGIAMAVPVVIGIIPFLIWALAARDLRDAASVTQSPAAFMWSESWTDVAVFPLMAWISALPMAFAMLFPWGPDARSEATDDHAHALQLAQSLCVCWLVTVGVWLVLGIGNPRYALPAAAVIAPIVGWVFAARQRGLSPKRETIARVLMLGHPIVWPLVLLVAFSGYLRFIEAPIRATSGQAAGESLARELASAVVENASAEPVMLFADGVVEARPEVLIALKQAWAIDTSTTGRTLKVVWKPGLARDQLNTFDAWYVLRNDDLENEVILIQDFLEPTVDAMFDVHRYRIGLYRSLDKP